MTTDPLAQAKPDMLQDFIRHARLALRRLGREQPLSRRFLATAVVVVALAMLVLGNSIGHYLQSSIAQGVAVSAAASIDSLIAHQISAIGAERELAEEERTRLDEVFQIGNDADSTRLLQISIWRLDGSMIYESAGGLVDKFRAEEFRVAAAQDTVSSSIADIPLEPVGPIPGHSLAVLRLSTPLHRPETGEVFAVAALYYSAKSLLEIQFQTQLAVWIVSGLVGLGVIGVLHAMVARASRTIVSQRQRLAANLVASRKLSEEVQTLHAESERLRLSANSANESLLAQVGSDIHDGPLQLLTLIILRLSKAASVSGGTPEQAAERSATLQLATEAMEELRNISTGLVLPELAPLGLEAAILLAISRHEDATGTAVRRELRDLPETISMAVKVCAYRIVQEALNNAYRHAGAAGTTVSASARDGRLSLAVANSARPGRNGADAQGAPNHEQTMRLGLRGMRFRVESLGGVLHADIGGSSAVSTVSAEIPITAGE